MTGETLPGRPGDNGRADPGPGAGERRHGYDGQRASTAGLLLAAVLSAAVVVLAAVLTGQGRPGAALAAARPSAPSVPRVPVTFSAVATQTRPDEAAGGLFEVELTNRGSSVLVLDRLRLDAPGFARLPMEPKSYPFRPGDTYDMRTPYGAARCEGAAANATRFSVVMDVHEPSARVRRVTIPLAQPNGLMTRIHAYECGQLALRRQVSVLLEPSWTSGMHAGAKVLRATVTVRRLHTTAAITVDDIEGSVIYDVRPAPGTALPLTAPSSAASVGLPVLIRVATCTGHALGETKKPYVFPLWVRLGGAERHYTEIPVTSAERAALFSFVKESCHLTS